MASDWDFKTAGPHVILDGVHQPLLDFTAHLNTIHKLLYGEFLTITSARDGQHVPASLHLTGKAIDVRTEDKDPQGNMLFLMVLVYAAEAMPITIFDERNLPGNPHIHIEWHGA